MSGRYPSRKMGVMIQFESHRVELAGIYEMEHDCDVLEYFDQPIPIKLEYESAAGKRMGVLHTPDFFVIRKARAGWEEWKTEAAPLPLAAGAIPVTVVLGHNIGEGVRPGPCYGDAGALAGGPASHDQRRSDGSGGDLPTTPGAFQTQFQQTENCVGTLTGCNYGPTSAFVTKFNAKGAGLVYSTYVPTDQQNNTVERVKAMLVDANSNAWFAGGRGVGLTTTGNVVEVNAAGSALLASRVERRIDIAALALDVDANVYAAGTTGYGARFPATPGAFQAAPQPSLPALPGQSIAPATDAFVIKWDSSLSQVLAATLLGGELADAATGIAIDAAGNVIVCGSTDSRAFPTRAAFQTIFAPRSGFVAALDSSLSHLLFSTYLGDGAFEARGVSVDAGGNLLVGGSTLSADLSHGLAGEPGQSYTFGN